ncbi:ATP phosphoribosyltransferase regulatory subunit, partial [Planctomycetota bacterium]
LESLYVVLDKKAKLPAETFEQMLAEQVPDKDAIAKISVFMKINSIPELGELLDAESEEFAAYSEIKEVLDTLETMGVGDFCIYDPGIVRGLAYYTGIVFEVHDAVGELRAICGGGRYDNLLRDFGGPAISATGMGMGDCVLEILLKEKGLLDKKVPKRQIDYFVACIGDIGSEAWRIIAKLRSMGCSANISYKTGGLSKQLKEASAQNANKCIIIGEEELKEGKIGIKDMSTGEQELVDRDEFFAGLDSA